MNRTLLCTALLALMTSTVHADNTANPSTPAADTNVSTSTLPAPAQPTAPAGVVKPVPASTAPQTPPVIDCNYHIPADTVHVDQSTISEWAGKATVKSFEFNPTSIDKELADLKPCYTDLGWKGFNDALQKSGNIEAIKTEHLSVSSQIEGNIKFNEAKDNQWKVTVPLRVVYQNDQEKLTQLLSIDLLIGRKVSGDLGIMQMIATPHQQEPANTPPTTQPTGTPPISSH